jgi:hypothetical protein
MAADTADGADGVVCSVLAHGRYPDGPRSQAPIAAEGDLNPKRAKRGLCSTQPASTALPAQFARSKALLLNNSNKVGLEFHRAHVQDEMASWGAAMNNVIRFPMRRSEACGICQAWPIGRRERLLIEGIPLKEAVCDDCLLAFWEHLMATEPARRIPPG